MDQYIRVPFATKRKVWVDGQASGFTNRVFQVETGHHVISLGSAKKNYSPEQRSVTVTGTTPTEPMIIEFVRMDS